MADTAKAQVGTVVAHEAGLKKAFPPLDSSTFASQLLWLALAFAALYFLLSKVALPRIGDVIDERKNRIARDLGEADRLKGETETALAAYEEALASAKTKAAVIVKENRERVGAEVDRERGAAEQQFARKLADAEQRIAATKTKALAGINDIAADTAGAIVAKLTGQDVAPADVKMVLAAVAGE